VRQKFEEACSIIDKDSRLATLPKSEMKLRKCAWKFRGTVLMLLLGPSEAAPFTSVTFDVAIFCTKKERRVCWLARRHGSFL
jgi:hypothetical protein